MNIFALSPEKQAAFDAKYRYFEDIIVERDATVAVGIGTRVNCSTGIETQARIVFQHEITSTGISVRVLNGGTGYESYYAKDMVDAVHAPHNDSGVFNICAGTPGCYDTLSISIESLKDVLHAFGFDIVGRFTAR